MVECATSRASNPDPLGRPNTAVMKRLVALLVAGGGLLSYAACGGGGAEVLVKGFRFQPARATVAAGGTVTWKQQDNTTHTITAGVPGRPLGTFDRRDFGRGDEFSFTFEKTGRFSYFCRRHPEGMRGSVDVE